MALQAYCVKCKEKRDIKDAAQTTMKNGKPAIAGTCATCGTKVFKMGATLESPAA
jgi:RNase P subunit RPR2